MDVNYNPGKSTTDLPITDPIHKPCPDMAGTNEFQPEKTKRAAYLIEKLREKHGLSKRVKRQSKPLNYVCTANRCVGV